MFEKNEALKVGQSVVAHTPFGDIAGTVERIAPTTGRRGNPFTVAEYGVTLNVQGEEFWALQEDVEIIGEVQ